MTIFVICIDQANGRYFAFRSDDPLKNAVSSMVDGAVGSLIMEHPGEVEQVIELDKDGRPGEC